MTAKRQLKSYSVQGRNRNNLHKHKYRKSGNLNNSMKENWEINWKDYYQILQVHPSAEPEVIKVAFERLARKYHPDINKAPTATQRMKDLNEAFEILNDVEKRKTYHAVYLQRVGKTNSGFSNSNAPPPNHPLPIPKPEVNPTTIRFTDVIPGETRKDTFIVRNSGGPFSKIWMSNTNSWLKIVSQRPLYGTGKLPLFVEIEAQGFEWGKTYVDNIIIKLDDVETHVRVELNTRIKVEQTNQNWNDETPSSGGGNQASDSSEKSKYGTTKTGKSGKEAIKKLFLLAVVLVGIIVAIAGFLNSNRTQTVLPSPSTTQNIIQKITPTLSVDRISGPQGSSVTVQGSGFNSNESGINITFDDIPIGAVISADANGNWINTFIVPVSASGSHSIAANGSITKSVPMTTFMITTAINLSETSGLPGSSLTVNGTGFIIYSTASLFWNGQTISIVPARAVDGKGNVTFTFNIPENYYQRICNIKVTDSSGNQASTTFTVLNQTTQISAAPSLTLTPSFGSPGTKITVNGFNFTPGGTVNSTDILFGDVPSTGTSFNIDASGSLAFSLTLTTDTAIGIYDVVVTDSSRKQAKAVFTVSTQTTTVSTTRLSSITIKLPASDSSLLVGSSLQLTAIGTYSDGSTENISSKVNWDSDFTQIATVSSAGLVTGISAGTAYINAWVPGTVGTATITVNSKLISITAATSDPSNLVVGSTRQFTANGRFADGELKSISSLVTWVSSNTSVAIVNSAGVVTGITPGMVTIAATLSGITSPPVSLRVVATTSTVIQTTQPPYVSLKPTSGSPGSQFTVVGYNFTPGGTVKSVDVTWNGSPLNGSQTFDVDNTGKVMFSLTLNASSTPGIYSLLVTDSSGKQASATFTINSIQTSTSN